MPSAVCPMQKIGFLTFDGHPDLSPDDQRFLPLMETHHLEAEIINWNRTPPEEVTCDALILRSPWDYYLKLDLFLKYLEDCQKRNIRLLNSLPLVRWNAKKDYLFDLEKRGFDVVPSLVIRSEDQIPQLLSDLEKKGWPQVVLKPTVSGSSFKTFLCENKNTDIIETSKNILSTHQLLAQPYLSTIETEGEISLIYFNDGKEHISSHAVLKKPKNQDFRVQVEYGGKTEAFSITPVLDLLARKILATVTEPWLYARVDLVDWQTKPLLSELEMIEPSLYFEFSKEAPEKFCQSLKTFLATK